MRFLGLLTLFIFNSLCWATDHPDFNGRDFSKLSHVEQLNFLKELRDVMAQTDASSLWLAEEIEKDKVERKPATQFEMRNTGGITYRYEGPLPPNQGLAREALRRFEEAVKGKTVISESDERFLENAVTMMISEAQSSSRRMSQDEITVEVKYLLSRASRYNLSPGAVYFIERQLTILKKNFGIDVEIPSEMKKKHEARVVSFDSSVAKAITPPTREVKSKSSEAAKEKPQAAQSEEVRATKKKEDVERTFEFSSCLYAGFIIKADVCAPPRTLQGDLAEAQIFDKTTFQCESPRQVICNPLLFGYEFLQDSDCGNKEKKANASCSLKKAKPVCIDTSVDATSQCQKKTSSDKYFERAAQVVREKPELLDQYLKDFKQLCKSGNSEKNKLIYKTANGGHRSNWEYIKKDIDKTCFVAMARLVELEEKYRTIAGKTNLELSSTPLNGPSFRPSKKTGSPGPDGESSGQK